VKSIKDDIDDFLDKIKKYFKVNSDMFDIDFFFLPERNIDPNKMPDLKNAKGFKVSYRYRTGMDEPEVKIEGNIDDEEIQNYLKNIDLNNIMKFQKLPHPESKNEIDAGELKLEDIRDSEDLYVLDPYTEINDHDDYTEIVIEVPGIKRENLGINFKENGKELLFSAKGKNREYFKKIPLPFKSNRDNCELNVNNGIVAIVARKLNE
jgi:HSP20 family molecular chaperone IbpA